MTNIFLNDASIEFLEGCRIKVLLFSKNIIVIVSSCFKFLKKSVYLSKLISWRWYHMLFACRQRTRFSVWWFEFDYRRFKLICNFCWLTKSFTLAYILHIFKKMYICAVCLNSFQGCHWCCRSIVTFCILLILFNVEWFFS